MAFMLIHQSLPGHQLSLYGSICHLPIEIGKIVKTLPRTLNEYETISVKLKCRLCYKNTVFDENVRPYKIIEALQYLLNNSNLYKEHNIHINPEWLNNFATSDTSTTHETTNETQKKEKENNDDSQMKKMQMKNLQMHQVLTLY